MLVAPLFLKDAQVELQCLPWTMGSSEPLQPLQMQSGTCSALARKGVRQLPDVAVDLGGQVRPQEWRESKKDTVNACRLRRKVQNSDHYV